MQFFCDQCKTKYSIADEKVAGKILKLRCKRCDSIIVLKDPRTAQSASEAPSSRGQQLLRDAFKKSFSEDLAGSPDVFPSAASEGPAEERTQIARLPLFESMTPPEEWYLSDSRGQFGPMDFAELVARIKRGEPDHDAVIWRDGFDDWKTIDRVPELRTYAKHLPPPRRGTREMFRESSTFQAPSSMATGAFPPTQANSVVVANPFVQAPGSASQSFRSSAMEYPIASPMMTAPMASSMAALEIQSAALQGARTRNMILMVLLVILGLGFLGSLFYFITRDKDKDKVPETPVVAHNPQPEQPMNASPKEEPQREVVYVIASQPAETELGLANPSAMGHGKSSPGTTRPDGGSDGADMGSSDAGMAGPSAGGPRGATEFNAVKQRNIMEIQRCYEMTVRKGQKELVGQSIKFAIRIEPSGTVESVSFTGEMPPMMRACLGSTIQKWQFPAGNKTDHYSFEMHFN